MKDEGRILRFVYAVAIVYIFASFSLPIYFAWGVAGTAIGINPYIGGLIGNGLFFLALTLVFAVQDRRDGADRTINE